MNHEKILVREDKTKISLMVRMCIHSLRDEVYWDVQVGIMPPNKRKFNYGVVDADDYQYHALSLDDRKKFYDKETLKIVTKEEILQAKLELWENIKPTMEV